MFGRRAKKILVVALLLSVCPMSNGCLAEIGQILMAVGQALSQIGMSPSSSTALQQNGSPVTLLGQTTAQPQFQQLQLQQQALQNRTTVPTVPYQTAAS